MTVQDVDNAFRKKADASVKLFGLRKKIENGTATMEDAAQYQMMLSKILGQTVGENILKIPESERVKFLDWILRNQYQETNDRLAVIQQFLDKQLGINIAPQKAPFPEERVNQLGRSLTDPTVPESTIQRRARAGTETVTKSFHDAYVKKNASFRSRAGLKCYITRKAVSGCCEWCTAMAGRYEYGEEPDDIYRRHDNCDCSVTYENGRKRQDVWSKREWETPEPGAGAGDPVVFTKEQAEALQKEKQLSVLNNERISNQSRAISIFNDYEVPDGAFITSQSIIDNMQTTSIGKEILDYIESVDEVFIRLDHKTVRVDANDKPIYGEEVQGNIVVYLLMCENAERAARTVIHECTHRRYGIGQSQWAECVCFAQELKHKYKRDYLTFDEKKRIIKAVQEGYPEYNWRKGGLINGERQSHYRPTEKR